MNRIARGLMGSCHFLAPLGNQAWIYVSMHLYSARCGGVPLPCCSVAVLRFYVTKYSAALAPSILRVSRGRSLGVADNLTSETPIGRARDQSVLDNSQFLCQELKLTRFFWFTTPSLIQTLQNPIMFAIMTSVVNRSPTIAI